MNRLRIASLVLIGLSVIMLIPLGLEIFTEMDPDRIQVLAVLFGIFFFSGNTCTIIRGLLVLHQKTKE